MKKRPLPANTKLYSEHAERVFKGERFDIYQWQQKLFDGSMATFETVKRNDTVVIIPIIDGEIVMVNEQQPHWDKPGLALVAGMANTDEDLAVAARRELEEETGLIFDSYYLVHVDGVAAAIEWFAYTFIATGYKGKKEKNLDPGEKNETVRISLESLIEKIRNKELLYHPRFIEDILVQGKPEELRDIFKNPEKYAIE
jgi:ADP-ribose pyrophosphatase YjhB (NUDIX family)